MKCLILVCVAVSAAAALECGICLRGLCLKTPKFNSSSDGTIDNIQSRAHSKIAIDYKNNILYTVDEKDLKAIDLDKKIITNVPVKHPHMKLQYVRVDQGSGDVYYSYDYLPAVYKYQPKMKVTKVIDLDYYKLKNMWVHKGRIYFTDSEKRLFVKTSTAKIDALDHFDVLDIVFDIADNMYVSTGDKVYKSEGGQKRITVSRTSQSSLYRLTSNGTGDVLIYDTDKRAIYQVDLFTNKMSKVGVYKDYAHELYFGKNYDVIIQLSQSCSYFRATSEPCMY